MPAASINVVATPSTGDVAPATVTRQDGFYELELAVGHYRLCSTSGGSDECFALDIAPGDLRRIEGVPNGLVGWHWAEAICPTRR